MLGPCPRDESYGGVTGVSRACPERSRRVQPGGDARLSTSKRLVARSYKRILRFPHAVAKRNASP